MKNAGKACNNRLYRHIRTFEKIIKNYFVIYFKYITKIEEEVRALTGYKFDECNNDGMISWYEGRRI